MPSPRSLLLPHPEHALAPRLAKLLATGKSEEDHGLPGRVRYLSPIWGDKWSALPFLRFLDR